MGTPTSWMSFIVLVSFTLVHGYDDVGFDGWYQPVPHRPVDIITDVINDLGVRILQQYTSHGNVAFSPTGVGFVLAALYEGSAGRGRQQIADALGLPRDPDVTRIGYRDIHRRLRTYLNADGFLGGLTLNQEYTKLRPDYEDVLRFYGFDLSIPDEGNQTTSAADTTTTEPVTETGQTMSDEATTSPVEEATASPTTQSVQNEANSEAITSTISTVEIIDTTLNTAEMQSRLTQTTSANTVTMETTMANTVSSQTVTPSTEQTTPETSTIPSVFEETLTTMSPVRSTTVTSTTVQPVSTSGETTVSASTETNSLSSTTSGSSALIDGPETTTSTTVANSGVTEPSSESTTPSSMTETTTIEVSTTTASINAMDSTSSTISNEANGSTNGPPADENTVSAVPVEMESTDLPVTTTVTGETGSNLQATTASSNISDATNRIGKRSVRSPRGYFSSYPDEGIWMQDLGIWKPYSSSFSEASVRDSTEISFLVNGCDVSSVTASRYFAVLPFAYFPSLHAVALEFPLDDPRYNILLLMATDRRDTYRLARDLGGKSLRLLRKQLQATWVRATIPSFMLRGFVTLTSFLQRLGIVDVFEPRAADLTPMTSDLGVYARDVQQSIGVNIRNYMQPDRTHSRNGLFERAGPVPFAVVHPFLYFIVDAETSVTLIAGRVNDPLNSRIL